LPKPAHKTALSAPLRALKHRGLLTMSLTALCYNWGFFTVLGYAPFPMNLSPIKLGLVFTGWGIFVALFAVFGAPRLQASLGIAKTMYANLAAFAVVVLVIAIWTTDRAVLIPAVIISGIFIGVNNTVTTQAVMTVSPVEKPVASATDLSHAPLPPCCANLNTEPAIGSCAWFADIPVSRCPWRTESGRDSPLRARSTGLSSNVSICEGPPAMNR